MSKLAPCTETATPEQLQWAGRAAGVKCFDGHLEAAKAALATDPEAVIIYRHQPDDNAVDPAAACQKLADEGIHGPNVFVEGTRNEPQVSDGHGGTNWDVVATLETETRAAVAIVHAAGYRMLGLNLGTGQPEDEFWTYFNAHGFFGLDPAVDGVGTHEYSVGGEIDGWNMGRFQRGLSLSGWTGPWVINECGRDDGDGPGGGWQDQDATWPGTLDAMYDLLTRYSALLEQFPQILLATVFSADGWPSFYFADDRQQFSGGNHMATPTTDPAVQQVLDQNALIAQALYDLTKVISQYPSSAGEPFADLVQDAKTKVNALNPAKFTFS